MTKQNHEIHPLDSETAKGILRNYKLTRDQLHKGIQLCAKAENTKIDEITGISDAGIFFSANKGLGYIPWVPVLEALGLPLNIWAILKQLTPPAHNQKIPVTKMQAAYIVAALHFSLTDKNDLTEKDRMYMQAIMIDLSSQLDLSDDVKTKLDIA